MKDDLNKNLNEGWVSSLSAGDHRAFAEFVDKYKEMVFLCCHTLGLKDDEAEDVAIETFWAAYKGLNKFRGQAEISTWLWKITCYKSISYLRKNKRQRELTEIPDTQTADPKSEQAINSLEDKEQVELIWQAVGKLPKLWSLAIVLFYREEKSVDEIAKIMKIRKNTIKTYLFRGRKILKELLADFVGEDTYAG